MFLKGYPPIFKFKEKMEKFKSFNSILVMTWDFVLFWRESLQLLDTLPIRSFNCAHV
jgi:hypothetical protein